MRFSRIGGLILLLGACLGLPAAAAVKIQIVRDRPIVDGVFINGHGPYRFLIDTGTTLNHLDPKLAASIGLKPTLRTELLSSTGATTALGAADVHVAIDSVEAAGQVFLFAGLDVIQKHFPQVQGVLGEEFLSRFDYLLDLRRKQIEFGKREPDTTELRAEFQRVAGRPVVTTNLGPLVLDSGASWVTLFGVNAPARTREMVTLTGSTKVGTVAREVTIGGRTLWRGDAIAIPPSPETQTAGLLPMKLFRAVYVCNSEGYLVLW
jgi:predicted aspartyl protease